MSTAYPYMPRFPEQKQPPPSIEAFIPVIHCPKCDWHLRMCDDGTCHCDNKYCAGFEKKYKRPKVLLFEVQE
jgi:hypothetical protein